MLKKIMKYGGAAIAIVLITLAVFVFVLYKDIEFGGDPLSDKLKLLQASPHFHDEEFHNSVPARSNDLWVTLKEIMGDQNRTPPAPFPLVKPVYKDSIDPGLRAVWFGHASVLVEIDGFRVFFDPMLSQHAFLLKAVAPERMNPSPLTLEDLPKIDVVIITHDHFDHLDMKTIQHLDKQGSAFFAGLGVGAHLEKWGVAGNRIYEMDWGDSVKYGALRVVCTEARHYSGRKSISNNTLWTSWVVKGIEHTVYHSGDSGYSPHFKEIGEQFLDIDMSLIKVGDYGIDLGWQDIHMIPENSVQAHVDIGAKVMIPIHWGVFQLSYHDWDEPIERTLKAAKKHNIVLSTPKLGEVVQLGGPYPDETWWRNLK